jgi:hypothetical protein
MSRSKTSDEEEDGKCVDTTHSQASIHESSILRIKGS